LSDGSVEKIVKIGQRELILNLNELAYKADAKAKFMLPYRMLLSETEQQDLETARV